MDSERLMQRAEMHVTLRKGLMIINALAYLGWIGSQGLAHAQAFGIDPPVWEVIGNLSMPVWTISLLLIVSQLGMLKRNRDLARLVDDERSAAKTNLAFKSGYWVLLIAVAVLHAATFFIPAMDLRTILPLLLAAGVTAPAFAAIFFGGD